MSNVPPEIMALLEQLSQGGMAEDQNDLLGAQYKTADELRRTKMPEAQMYGANHVAPINPMQIAAAAIQQYRGGQQQRDTMDQMKGNLGTVGAGVRALLLAKLLREYPDKAQTPTPEAGTPALAAPPGAGMTGFADVAPWDDPLSGNPLTPPAAPRKPKVVAPPPAPVGPPARGGTGGW